MSTVQWECFWALLKRVRLRTQTMRKIQRYCLCWYWTAHFLAKYTWFVQTNNGKRIQVTWHVQIYKSANRGSRWVQCSGSVFEHYWREFAWELKLWEKYKGTACVDTELLIFLRSIPDLCRQTTARGFKSLDMYKTARIAIVFCRRCGWPVGVSTPKNHVS